MKLSKRGVPNHSIRGLCAIPLLISIASSPEVVGQSDPMGQAKFVDVEGIRTRYFEGGSGEAVLLVHGAQFGSAAGSADNWMPIFPRLAEHFHVFAVDKLGMGLTDNPATDEDYTMQATVQHLYRFLERLGIDQVHLVGHSRGGLPVARIAIDHPERVKTLTIFDSNTLAPVDPPTSPTRLPPPGPPPSKESIRQALLSSDSTFNKDFITDEYVEAQLKVASHPKIREAAEKFEELRKRFVELHPEKVKERPALSRNRGTGWWMYEVKDETLEMIRAGRLQTPTLIIWGFNDPSATYQMGVDLFQLISPFVDRAQLHFLNRSGHFPFHEYPGTVTDLMVGFLGGGTP